MKMFSSQRGAMFGLDARIALVIFAGLSGLIGYYMLSTAQESRVRGLAQDIGAVREAVNDMQRDLRVNIHTVSGADDRAFTALYDASVLKSSARARWNGPYIDQRSNKHRTFGEMSLVERNNDGTACAASGIGGAITATCMVYLRMAGVPEDIVSRLDSLIDNYEGNPTPDPPTQGAMTWAIDTTADDGTFWFQVRLTQAFPK